MKHHATTHIKAGAATICDTKDLFDYCKQSKLHKQPEAQAQACKTHFFRSFFWVESTDIVRQRNRPVKTLKGTRSLHGVKCVEQNVILTRNLSCFCNSRRSGVGHCENTNTAGNWHREELIPVGPQCQPPAAQHPPAVAAPQHQPAAAQDLPPVATPDVVPAVPVTDMPAVRPLSPEIEGLQPKTGDFLEVELDGHNRAVIFWGAKFCQQIHQISMYNSLKKRQGQFCMCGPMMLGFLYTK